MFDLSKKTDYGLEFLTALVKNYQKGPVSLREIASQKKLPLKYLEQIITPLREFGLVEAKEGKGGGYFLVKNPKKVTLAEAVEMIEGPTESNCSFCPKFRDCGQKDVWAEVDQKVKETFREKTLADLVK